MVGIDGTEVDDDFKEFAEEYKFGTVILLARISQMQNSLLILLIL